jgi:hypothetical protein
LVWTAEWARVLVKSAVRVAGAVKERRASRVTVGSRVRDERTDTVYVLIVLIFS